MQVRYFSNSIDSFGLVGWVDRSRNCLIWLAIVMNHANFHFKSQYWSSDATVIRGQSDASYSLSLQVTA